MDTRTRARIASLTRWAHEPDRSAATRPGTNALLASFEAAVDPDGVLTPEERGKRADALKRAHFQRLAAKSAEARRKRAA